MLPLTWIPVAGFHQNEPIEKTIWFEQGSMGSDSDDLQDDGINST